MCGDQFNRPTLSPVMADAIARVLISIDEKLVEQEARASDDESGPTGRDRGGLGFRRAGD